MGREYWLSRNSRVRQEGSRRHTRISAAVRIAFQPDGLDPLTVMAGIDVGEDFLGGATCLPATHRLNLARVDLRKLSGTRVRHPRRLHFKPDPISSLSATLLSTVPELRGAIALVDSPRWPSDLHCSQLISRANR